MHTEDLKNCKDEEDVVQALRKVPKDAVTMFKTRLSSIDPRQVERARNIFCWLAGATYPLPLDALATAPGISLKSSDNLQKNCGHILVTVEDTSEAGTNEATPAESVPAICLANASPPAQARNNTTDPADGQDSVHISNDDVLSSEPNEPWASTAKPDHDPSWFWSVPKPCGPTKRVEFQDPSSRQILMELSTSKDDDLENSSQSLSKFCLNECAVHAEIAPSCLLYLRRCSEEPLDLADTSHVNLPLLIMPR